MQHSIESSRSFERFSKTQAEARIACSRNRRKQNLVAALNSFRYLMEGNNVFRRNSQQDPAPTSHRDIFDNECARGRQWIKAQVSDVAAMRISKDNF